MKTSITKNEKSVRRAAANQKSTSPKNSLQRQAAPPKKQAQAKLQHQIEQSAYQAQGQLVQRMAQGYLSSANPSTAAGKAPIQTKQTSTVVQLESSAYKNSHGDTYNVYPPKDILTDLSAAYQGWKNNGTTSGQSAAQAKTMRSGQFNQLVAQWKRRGGKTKEKNVITQFVEGSLSGGKGVKSLKARAQGRAKGFVWHVRVVPD